MHLQRTKPASSVERIKQFKSPRKIFSILIILFIALCVISFTGDGKKKSSSIQNPALTRYLFKVNKIELPMNNIGTLADVAIPGGRLGIYDDIIFLFSGGFFLGGYKNDFLWVNGVASASRIGDYQPGKVGMDKSDQRAELYILKSSDAPFGSSWQEWKTAVELGAEFYDGDGNGVYNPVDKNKNGFWDLNEDRPGLIGDETVWCVYNDGVPRDMRRYNDVDPIGIEIHQTVFGYKEGESLSNTVFVKYRIINTGNVTDKLDSIIFSCWTDPDLGDYTDDLVGCDTLFNTGYCYNDGSDVAYGNNPPAMFTQVIQGPHSFMPNVTFMDANGNGKFDEGEVPLNDAFEFVSHFQPKRKIVGAKNLTLSSYGNFLWTHPIGEVDNRFIRWNYLNGLYRNGDLINPCTWYFGVVLGGVNCSQINPRLHYSGDPIARIGWINSSRDDQRMMTNVGRFQLIKDKPVDIIVAYTLGRGTDALNSITKGKRFLSYNNSFFEYSFQNLAKLSEVKPHFRTAEDKIDISWETAADFAYQELKKSSYGDTVRNVQIEGYELWLHCTPSIDTIVGGRLNSIKLASYDVENKIDNIYRKTDHIGIEKILSKGIQLKREIYSNPERGRIVYSLTNDPFNDDKPLIKGKPYYFSIKKIGLNNSSLHLIQIDPATKSYLIIDRFGATITESERKVWTVIPGIDLNSPYRYESNPIVSLSSATESKVVFEEAEKDKLTNDEYSITFFKDSLSTSYSVYWRMKNLTKGKLELDSQKVYSNKDEALPIVDGIIPRIEWIEPKIKDPIYQSIKSQWFKPPVNEVSGVFYMGSDASYKIIKPLSSPGATKSKITKYDNLRQLEIRFGPKQKAYRYMSNTFGTSYMSAGSNTSPSIGKPGEYFVEVPFQIWVKDFRFKEERQLACGFTERLSGPGAYPDGIWDPKESLDSTREYIIIFNSSYDSSGKQMEYVGYTPATGTNIWANLRGWTPPAAAGFTAEQTVKAKSPWFDALYVLGFEKKSAYQFYTSGDVNTIPISYVLTERDTFYYKSKSKSEALTIDERKKMIERINVYPNPYFEWENPRDYLPSYQSFISFSNLPEEVTIKIYSLSGIHVRTLTESNKTSISSPFLNWDLKNENGSKVSSGMYIAWVSSKFGERVLKFAIVNQRRN